MGPLALLGSAFYAVLVHRLTIYAPRFFPTLGHPHAVALHFIRGDQFLGVNSCWAHPQKGLPLYRQALKSAATLGQR